MIKKEVVACWLLTAFLALMLTACQTPGGSVRLNWPPDNGVEEDVAVAPRGHGPPDHAPAHGYRRKYGYRYYPDAQVYFDIERKNYFYLDGGQWRVSVSLPQELKVRLGDHVELEMDSDKPYTEYEMHKKKYPPGQLKKKKKYKKNKKWD